LSSLLDISTLTPAKFKSLISNFSCTNQKLNNYLKDNAYNHCVKDGVSKTYFIINNNVVLSYITLTLDIIALIDKEDLTQVEIYNKYKNHCNLGNGYHFPIPAIKIARLATDQNHVKKGYAAILFQLSEIKAYITQFHEGCKLITVDAENDAIRFYEKMGFKKLSDNVINEYTPMLFTIHTIKRLPTEKKKEMIEYCDMFNLEYVFRFSE
jgi:GNAT superfamily N-acetyltransferase